MSAVRTIWKYSFGPLHEMRANKEFEMPEGAKVLHIANQAGQLCLWAEVEPGRPNEPRWFGVISTGYRFSASGDTRDEYVGTALFHRDTLVLHVYELVKVKP